MKNIEIHIFSNKKIKNELNFKFYQIKRNYIKFIESYDMVLISGGFIKFEMLYLGLPTFYFTIEKHQTKLAKYFSQNSLGLFVSDINNIQNNNTKTKKILNNYINSYFLRKKMFNYYRKKIDGRGFEKIKNIIKEK